MTMGRKRYTKKDFAWVKWTPKDVKKKAEDIIRLKKERYALIKKIPAKDRTFLNTVVALEASDDDLSDLSAMITIHKDASPSAALRTAAGEATERLSKALVEIEFDPGMYRAVMEYAAKKERLTGPDKILFDDMKKGYERMGFTLPKAKQQKLKKNLKRLGQLGIAFDRNLNEYKDHILVTKEELDGLPDSYIANLKKEGGKYKITLAYPDSRPYMAGAHNKAKRKELSEKLSRKGGVKNVAIIKEMFKIRAENAKLLGYTNHVDYKLEMRMAKNARTVRRFINDILGKTKKAAEKDRQMLGTYKRKREKDPKAKLHDYDIGYLFKQLRKEKFDIDSDFVKEHFPFEHVKQGTLDAYQKLLGVSFKRRNDIPLWHPDVQFYDIHDPKEGYLSSFALDLYPRDGKYGHAAVFDIIMGRENPDGSYTPPLAAMIANFPKPSKKNPSLMSHGEVETFFHEFGHVVHFTLTKAKYRAQAGTNTAWDFVEAPSQMLENWVWDENMLARLSKHYKTGKPLPKALVRRMIKARLFGEAWSVRGQALYALFDHLLHTGEGKDPVRLFDRLERELMGIPPPKGQLFIAGFGHLAHGYDAGYYGYLWSRVYAEDMFTRFKKAGILNPKVGKDYRAWVLEKGSSMKEMELIKGFLGRKPNSKAFLKSIGV
jgi:thimet oligopeptidase